MYQNQYNISILLGQISIFKNHISNIFYEPLQPSFFPQLPNQHFQVALCDLQKLNIELPCEILTRSAIGYAGICVLNSSKSQTKDNIHLLSQQATIAECLYSYDQLIENEMLEDIFNSISELQLILDFIQMFQLKIRRLFINKFQYSSCILNEPKYQEKY
ncbi:hypothetical protein ABPG74_005144 [Tetrahymena malaccensis]